MRTSSMVGASILLAWLWACGAGGDDDDEDAPDGGGGDGDADADSDADADGDGDADGDADAGTDAGSACDLDGDGARSRECGGDDCDDDASEVRPGQPDEPVFEVVDTGELASTRFDLAGYTPGGLAVDPSGWAALAYFDGEDLRYATNESGAWATEIARGLAGGWVSLALDAAGAAHIGFGDQTPLQQGSGYATNAGGAWEFDLVSTHLPALEGSIVVDDAGAPGLAYVTTNLLSQTVGWTSFADDTWSAEEASAADGGRPFVALDASGEPFICFKRGGALWVAFRALGVWTAEQAGSNRCSGIAVAQDGTVHVTSTSDDQHNPAPLVHLVRIGVDAWEATEVAPASVHFAPLVLDPNGDVHVAFRPSVDVDTTLEYATDESGAWRTATLAEPEAGRRLGGPALAVDAAGMVHVAHLSIPTGDDADPAAVELRYARFAPPNTIDDDCDGTTW